VEIGRITGAEVVLLGSFQRAEGQLRASARFIDAKSGEVLDAKMIVRPADKAFDLQDAVASDVQAAVSAIGRNLRLGE
jgi:TolB-like protein